MKSNGWIFRTLLFLALLGWSMNVYAASTAKDSSLEKARLENERMKLENERLKLEIEKMKVEKGTAGGGIMVAPSSRKAVKMEGERLRAETASASSVLAEAAKADLAKVILDLANGELWYKGVRSNMNDFSELCEREGWKASSLVEKRRSNGWGRVRKTYKNLSAGKYEDRKRGTFTWTASGEEGAFTFEMPEGLTDESSYDEFRNKSEGPYYSYDGSGHKSKMAFLRFKHKAKFTEFGEKVRFWFNKEKRLVKVEWGVLDEN